MLDFHEYSLTAKSDILQHTCFVIQYIRHSLMRIQNKFIRYLIYIVGTLLFFAAAVFAYMYTFRNELKQQALKELNTHLQTQIQVSHIRMDLFTQFPRISLVFEQVEVQDAFHSATPLLKAEQVAIGFNVLDVWRKNYRISSLKIAQAELHIAINANGLANYHIIKTKDTTSDEIALINLQHIQLSDVKLLYDYNPASYRQDMFIDNAICSVNLLKDSWEFNLEQEGFVNSISMGKKSLMNDKTLQARARIIYQINEDKWLFEQTNYHLSDLNFTADGYYTFGKKADDIKIEVKAAKTSIRQLLSLLPVKPAELNDWQSGGDVQLSGIIEGKRSNTVSPKMMFQFTVQNGTLSNSKLNFIANSINCRGKLAMTNGQSELDLKQVQMRSGTSEMKGEMSITNFDQPFITADVKGILSADDALKLMLSEYVRSASGDVKYACKVQASLKELRNSKLMSSEALTGKFTVSFANIVLKNSETRIQSLQAEMALNKDLLIDELKVKTNKSDVRLHGYVNGLAPMLFAGKPADIHLTLNAEQVYTSDWLMGHTQSTTQHDTATSVIRSLNLDMHVNKLVHENIEARELHVKVRVTDLGIEFNDLDVQLFGGNIKGNARMLRYGNKPDVLTTQLAYDALDIQRLFAECNNFGQQELTSAHVSGTLSGSIQMSLPVNDKNEFMVSGLTALADMHLKNGTIQKYEPLKKLSRFADVDELTQLRFSDLKNSFMIQNSVITIPEMDIVSNALNLTLSGTQAFDGLMDYRIKMRLSELLKRKRKPQPQTDEVQEEEEGGRGMFIFLTMKGYADNLKIAYDKVSVKKKVKQDLSEEKERIKDVLKKELGIRKDPTIKEKNTNDDELEFEQE